MTETLRRIPVCQPFMNGNETTYVADALQSSWISSSGKYLTAFEQGFAAYVGQRHGIGTTNGTAALHLALRASGIVPGDEVILPDFTMIAPALAICYVGAVPVLVDADPETWTLDVQSIEKKITSKTKAILAVHIYGHPCEMAPIQDLCRKRGIILIEDAAEAHGAEYKGVRCGALGDLAAFSFYANKIITTGEGGMVVTSNDALADRCRYFRNLCFPLDAPREFRHNDIGFNYRMTNLQGALGLAQLEKIEDYITRRRHNAQRYNSLFQDHPCIQRPVEKPWAKNCYWMYGIVLKDSARISRDALMARLSGEGIETRPFFTPMHRQPMLQRYGMRTHGTYAVSDRLAVRGLYLPSGSNLNEEDLLSVAESVKRCLS